MHKKYCLQSRRSVQHEKLYLYPFQIGQDFCLDSPEPLLLTLCNLWFFGAQQRFWSACRYVNAGMQVHWAVWSKIHFLYCCLLLITQATSSWPFMLKITNIGHKLRYDLTSAKIGKKSVNWRILSNIQDKLLSLRLLMLKFESKVHIRLKKQIL